MDNMGNDLAPILVTGASGFLGGEILSTLHRCGINSYGIGRSKQCDIICDLLDPVATAELIKKYPHSCIIHCAASVPKTKKEYMDKNDAARNLEMVRNLANAKPHRIVFVSSMTVYPDNITLAHEDDAIEHAGNGYAATKFRSEKILLNSSNTITTILRLPGLFGQPRRQGILYNTALVLTQGGTPDLDKSLPQWSTLHVSDAAEICIRAVSHGPVSSMVINAGYPGRMSISDAIRQLAELFDRELDLPPPKWFAFDLQVLHRVLGPVQNSFDIRLREFMSWVKKELVM